MHLINKVKLLTGLLCCFGFVVQTQAQQIDFNQKILLPKQNYNLSQVFEILIIDYNINLSYDNELESIKTVLNFPKKDYTLESALDEIKKQCTVIEFVIKDNSIVAKKKKALKKYTINGYIEDGSSGEKLPGANVYNELSYTGTSTNMYGYFSITLPEGNNKLVVSYVGYKRYEQDIKLNSDTTIHIKVSPVIEIEEVRIEGTRSEFNTRSQLSVIKVSAKEVNKIPALLGETDVLKSLQLLPGVQSGMEGFSGLVVRGGGPDQNLIILDGVPVYNVNHLFGFFSVFNSNAIRDVSLYKSGFPARYGGRASSVIDINMKEGNNKEFHGEGSIGLISSRLTLEGPIGNENTSFMISGRRTYIDVLARPWLTKSEDGITTSYGYYFYDLNMKINHRFSDKSRLFLSSYLGNDVFRYTMDINDEDNEANGKYGLKWGNITTNLRWNYIINNKMFANTTLSYSKYRFLLGYNGKTKEVEDNETEITKDSQEFLNGIYDVSGKVDFDYFPNPNHKVKFGAAYYYHTFIPSSYTRKEDPGKDTSTRETIYGNEAFLYLEDDIRIGTKVNVNAGLHGSFFKAKEQGYFHIQPRISANYSPWSNVAFKASYSKMVQYLQTNSYSSMSLPIDLWVPSTDSLVPVESHNFSLGLDYQYAKKYSIGVEGFYKTMDNVLTFKEGAFPRPDFLSDIVQGKGWAYGFEFMIRKNTGKTTGWLSYTWSHSWRKFDGISFDKKYPYKYDRTHDISLVVIHQFNDRVDIGGTWVFGTGNNMSLSTEKYISNFTLEAYSYEEVVKPYIQQYETRNNYRMPNYHRMDIGVNFHKEKKKYTRTWSFGAYNVYNRKNPFWIHWDNLNQFTDDTYLYQVSLFQIIPYFSYSVKF